MADKIHASSEWLDQCSTQLGSVTQAIQSAAGVLAGINLRRDEGGDLRTSMTVRLAISGQSFSGSNAAEDIRQLSSAARSLTQSAGRMRDGARAAARVFERVENGAVAAITAVAGGQDTVVYPDGGGELAGLVGSYDGDTRTFDHDKSNGSYGADQGDMAHNKKGMWFFGFRWFEDEDLFAYIRQHSRYQNYSQTQIAALLDRINSEGCGYVAIVNNIFVEYEGKEEEFERVFGFPMYDKNGKPNYNYLIVDFYANTDDRYYINEPKGATALVNDIILDYEGREDEFRAKYGCDPLIDGKYFNPQAQQAILDEYQGQSVVTKEVSGTTTYSLENRFQHYMEQKGVKYEVNTYSGSSLTTNDVNNYIENGKNVNIATGSFNLYNENGTIAAKNVGDHWMTVTGVTEDGRYIVSSWGGKYYINPSELNGSNFCVTDIRP